MEKLTLREPTREELHNSQEATHLPKAGGKLQHKETVCNEFRGLEKTLKKVQAELEKVKLEKSQGLDEQQVQQLLNAEKDRLESIWKERLEEREEEHKVFLQEALDQARKHGRNYGQTVKRCCVKISTHASSLTHIKHRTRATIDEEMEKMFGFVSKSMLEVCSRANREKARLKQTYSNQEKQLSDQILSLEASLSASNQQVEALMERLESITGLERQRKVENEQMREASKMEMLQHEEKVKSLEKLLKERESEIVGLLKQVTGFESRQDSLQNTIKDLRNQLKLLASEKNEMQSSINALKQDQTTQLNLKTEECIEKDQELHRVKAERQSLEAQLKILENNLQEAKLENESREQGYKIELQQVLRNLDDTQRCLKDCQQQLDQNQQDWVKLKQQKAHELHQLEQQLQSNQTEMREMVDLLEKEKLAKQSKVQELTNRLEEQQKQQREIAELLEKEKFAKQSKVQELTTLLEAQQNQLESHRVKSQAKIRELETDLNDISRQRSELQSKYQIQLMEVDGWKSKYSKLEQQFEQYKQENHTGRNDNNAITEEGLEAMERHLIKLSELVRQKDAEIKVLQATVHNQCLERTNLLNLK